MGWVRMDDGYATHTKLVVAGLEARGLDVAGICWSAQHETDGFVPDAVVAMLGGRLVGGRSVKALVDVGRWTRNHEREGYDIHDFLEYNYSHEQCEAKREADRVRKETSRKRAGRTDKGTFMSGGLSGRTDSGTPPGIPPDDPPDDPPESERGPVGVTGGVTRNPTRPDPTPKNPSSSVSDLNRAEAAPDDDPNPSALVDVWPVLARRQLAVRLVEVGPVGAEPKWLGSAETRTRDRHRAKAEAFVDAEPSMSVEQLADMLEPPRPASPPAEARRNGRPADPLDSTAAAQRERAERAQRRAEGRPECSRCEDAGVVELDDGTWEHCDHRMPATAEAS